MLEEVDLPGRSLQRRTLQRIFEGVNGNEDEQERKQDHVDTSTHFLGLFEKDAKNQIAEKGGEMSFRNR